MGIDPLTIAVISGGLQVASGIMGYVEQKKADKAAKRAAFAEAKIMEQDAARAAEEERRAAEKHRKTQKALFLKSGIDLSGSPLLVMEETRRKGEENARNIVESASARAKLTRQQGSVKRASLLGSAADTASGLFSTYATYKQLESATPKKLSKNDITWSGPRYGG